MLPNDGRVVSNFIIQALKNQDITIYGEGYQTRSFCYVDDLIEGFIRMMASDLTGPVNLGNPPERTILDLAKLLLSLTNSNSKLIFTPLPSDYPIKRRPDFSLANRELDWEHKVDIECGLAKTIDYFNQLNAVKC